MIAWNCVIGVICVVVVGLDWWTAVKDDVISLIVLSELILDALNLKKNLAKIEDQKTTSQHTMSYVGEENGHQFHKLKDWWCLYFHFKRNRNRRHQFPSQWLTDVFWAEPPYEFTRHKVSSQKSACLPPLIGEPWLHTWQAWCFFFPMDYGSNWAMKKTLVGWVIYGVILPS